MKKKKKGAQPKNQNARKHGFYSRVLDDAETALLESAASVEGLDEEIAILRVKLSQCLMNNPENVELALDAANTLARLVRTRYNISKEQKNSLKEAITKVITEIAVPLGIKTIFR